MEHPGQLAGPGRARPGSASGSHRGPAPGRAASCPAACWAHSRPRTPREADATIDPCRRWEDQGSVWYLRSGPGRARTKPAGHLPATPAPLHGLCLLLAAPGCWGWELLRTCEGTKSEVGIRPEGGGTWGECPCAGGGGSLWRDSEWPTGPRCLGVALPAGGFAVSPLAQTGPHAPGCVLGPTASPCTSQEGPETVRGVLWRPLCPLCVQPPARDAETPRCWRGEEERGGGGRAGRGLSQITAGKEACVLFPCQLAISSLPPALSSGIPATASRE